MTKEDHTAFSFPYPVLPEGWIPYDDEKDYCGPENKWYSKYLSRYILGVDLNRVYWAHDNRYRLGKTKTEKKFADKQMRRDQNIAICRAYGWWNPMRYVAQIKALRRYHVVSWLGQEAFDAASS